MSQDKIESLGKDRNGLLNKPYDQTLNEHMMSLMIYHSRS